MTDLNDNNASDATSIDDLVSAIRSAVASDASSEARASGVSAARAILRGLEPSPTRNGAPSSSPTGMLAGTPLGAALGALGSVPREQILEFIVSGARALLGQGSPTYRTAPLHRTPDTTERSG